MCGSLARGRRRRHGAGLLLERIRRDAGCPGQLAGDIERFWPSVRNPRTEIGGVDAVGGAGLRADRPRLHRIGRSEGPQRDARGMQAVVHRSVSTPSVWPCVGCHDHGRRVDLPRHLGDDIAWVAMPYHECATGLVRQRFEAGMHEGDSRPTGSTQQGGIEHEERHNVSESGCGGERWVVAETKVSAEPPDGRPGASRRHPPGVPAVPRLPNLW